jgi:pimeloyl-ACP methyl ester carboxylesterase
MADSAELGTEHTVELPQGTLAYRERGEGPPVVFVHGLLVNGDLWRKVVPPVAAAGFRCLTPDWPLGSHRHPMRPDADLTPPGLARMVADFLAALDLREVTLVANDTGGAITQLVMTRHPDRVGRVVLTPCDCFEKFFPQPFTALPAAARLPGFGLLLAQVLRPQALQRLPMAYGWLTNEPIDPAVMRSYLAPSRTDPAIRRDLTQFVRGVHKRYTLAAAEQLHRFDRPVLLAWAARDRVFPATLATRLADRLPDARIELIDDSRTFVPEDQPGLLAELVVKFLR